MNRDPRIARRKFLQAAAIALPAPYVITSTALGAAGKPPASERVTVALLGCGGRGLGGVGGQLVAACDPWKNRRERFGKGVTPYADFREALARDDIDAVAIGACDHWHVPMTVAAAKAGKDMYCEKPLGVSIREDQICREAVNRYNRVFQYGTQQRSSNHCRFGCELVRSGKIGQVKEIIVYAPDSHPGGLLTPQPVPEGLDYEMWLGPAPWRPYCGQATGGDAWWHDYNYAIGFIAGWGAHPLDILVWGFDTRLAGNWEVEGTATIPATGRNNVVMRWDVKIHFANGVNMTFKPGADHTRFIGTEGWVGISRGGLTGQPESLLKLQLGANDVHLIQSSNHGGNFIEAVRSRATPVSNIDDAVHSDIISHVSDIAIRTKRKIVWDPAKEEIVGDPQAARMLARAWREPWQLS
ncbi:MAG: Gfo/Idh/MocA family oxidoreductase [Thermoguttaceae bacterium]|jgi:predicted dehydrogenase